MTSWTVNGLGVRTSRTDALSRTTSYTLDNWNRVTGVDYPAGTDPTFTYDAEDHLTGWTDGVGTWARTYDDCGRMLTESLGGSTRVTYTYDGTGKKGLLATTTDANSRVITYAYTSNNKLYTVNENSGTTTYSYDNNGNLTGVTNPNGSTVANVYDNADRLTSVTNAKANATVLSSFSYGYDNDNLQTSITEANSDVISFGYNAAHRLTSESRTGSNSYSKSYTLDGVGNRTSQTVGGTTTSFTINSDDELTATSGGFSNSYSYNSNGEQTSRTVGGTTYALSYDYEGQLTDISVGGSSQSSYVYDALGRRYSRTAGGSTTVFYLDPVGGNSVLAEKVGGSFTAAYAWGNGLIRRNGEYVFTDGQGNERTITNSSETTTGTLLQDAFGITVATTGSSSSPYMFSANSGYRDEGDAGLVVAGARRYDTQVGRFVTRDTVLTEHPYLYCEHDAANRVDPDGHDSKLWGVVRGLIKLIGQWEDADPDPGSLIKDIIKPEPKVGHPPKWWPGKKGKIGKYRIIRRGPSGRFTKLPGVGPWVLMPDVMPDLGPLLRDIARDHGYIK